MYAFVALLVFAVVVSAQRPRPCESPPQWEGRLFQAAPRRNITVLGKLSYDAFGERVRIIEDVDITRKRIFYDFIILYREVKWRKTLITPLLKGNQTNTLEPHGLDGKGDPPWQLIYRIELSINGTGKCIVSEFKEPFKPIAIPSDAEFATDAYIGTSIPRYGVLVNAFYGKAEQKGVTVDYFATVTSEGCLPVNSVEYIKNTGTVVHSSFYDISFGIPDPEHFVPPRDCGKAWRPAVIPMHL